MDLSVIFNAIVPDNIKELPLVKQCTKIFIEQLNRNSIIAQRISNLYDVDKKTWLQQNADGSVSAITDSEFVSASKSVLKTGLFQVYLNVLHSLILKMQLDNEITYGNTLRNYSNSLIYRDINNFLSQEYLGSFRYFQQNSGTQNAIKYIYQFAKYLETGYLYSDLNLLEGSGPFALGYQGSLQRKYFGAFIQPMAHPAGWCEEYECIIDLLLIDYFGIKIEYEMPKGISLRTVDGRYLVFTDKTLSELYQSLLEPNNFVSLKPLSEEEASAYTENQVFADEESMFEEIQNPKNRVVIVNKTFKHYESWSDNGLYYKIIYFTDGTCIYFNGKDTLYGLSADIFRPEKMTPMIGLYLNIGSEKQLVESRKIKILYYDIFDWFPMYLLDDKGKGYYEDCTENMFQLQGEPYPYVPGIDEGRTLISNNEECKNNLKCYDLKFNYNITDYSYVDVRDPFDNHFTDVREKGKHSEIVNTHGWKNSLKIRVLNGEDKGYSLNADFLNDVFSDVRITYINTIENDFIIKGIIKSNETYRLKLISDFESFEEEIKKSFSINKKLNNLTSNFIIKIFKNNSEVLSINSNDFNLDGFVGDFEFPHYSGELPVIPVIKKTGNESIDVDKVYLVGSGNKTLKELTNVDVECKFENGSIIEPPGFYDQSDKDYGCNTFIAKGYRFVKTDNTDNYIASSTKFVNDEFEWESSSEVLFLAFNSDVDEGSDSLGKYLIFNDKVSEVLVDEGIRSIIRGHFLSCQSSF